MSVMQSYINLGILREKFAHSKLLPILIRIYSRTNGLTTTNNINLSRDETSILLDVCDLEEFLNFDPAQALMTCLGTFFPQSDSIVSNTAMHKFKRHTKLEISVIISSGIAMISIKKI